MNALGYWINLVAPHAHYHVDLLGTGAFAVAAATAAAPSSLTRVHGSSMAVITWSIKLASFLFYRVIVSGHDARLDDILSNPKSAAGFWIFSMFWGLLGSLPHTLGCTSRLPGNSLAMKAGATLFGIGWITETLADYQKWAFKRRNPGQFCNAGLWSLSQHPNYFGNFLYVIRSALLSRLKVPYHGVCIV
jgi:steroid 5-alpha reductase family enzyme